MQTLAKIQLNFQQPNFVTVYAAQNDKLSRFVTVSLLDGSTPWTLPAGGLMTVKYCRADGVGGFYDTLEDDSPAYQINADGTVTIGLAEQLLAVAGQAAAELSFYTAAGAKLSTARFCVQVMPSAWADDKIIESEPYVNVLSKQIAAVLDAATAYTGMQASATTGEPGSAASVTVTGGEDGQPYHLNFSIPRGDPGPTGPQGPPGADGDGAVDSVMGVGSVLGDVPAAQLFNLIYPVGAVYISTNATDPGMLFGGTWARIKDSFLLAAGDVYAAGATGGSASNDLHNEPVHAGVGFVDGSTIGFDAPDDDTFEEGGVQLNYSFMPSHTATATGMLIRYGSALTRGVKLFGALNNLPPYLTVYIWQRTALAA